MQNSWRELIDNNRFEQQTFPIAATFSCSRYLCMYLSYDFTILANFADADGDRCELKPYAVCTHSAIHTAVAEL